MTLLLLLLLAMAPTASPVPSDSAQLVLVVSPDWSSPRAVLRRFARGPSGWEEVGTAMPVQVGRNGLAWGRGLHREAPVKKEGDGKAPAGVFRLSGVFGVGLGGQVDMPYTELDECFECVDDPASQFYNRVVDNRTVVKDWKSSERMLIEPYRVGVVVDHNADPPVPSGGSCIFLHVWQGATVPTAGCTATAEAQMAEVATWLRRESRPVLVQLPQAEYRRLREAWALP